MGKAGKAAAGAAAVASGPSGLRRLLGGGCLLVLLVIVGMAGCTAVVLHLGGDGIGGDSGAGEEHPSWPCDEPVRIRYGPDGAGWVPEAEKTATTKVVTRVIERSGRAVVQTDERDEDLLVNWSGIEDEQVAAKDSIRVGATPTSEWVEATLADRLTPCPDPAEATATVRPTGDEGPSTEPTAPEGAEGDALGPQVPTTPGIAWPRPTGAALVILAALSGWWIAGPPAVRALGWALGWAARSAHKTLARVRGRGDHGGDEE